MGANSCCFTSEHTDEAKSRVGDLSAKEDDKHVQFSDEAAKGGEAKTMRTKERKGTGYVKPEMFKDLIDEEDD
eukprot:CAMPEP_0181413826 /NCGR_PEP_ID=MMETSP1110-20121109/9180_1 /TAXON_ID=174948 /ORGANISM="Symbiodinium sp., Strain CCMP421" /LENGTH=72 /DNA_ID=CAMNT_0023536667 /DNA_START=62 /DNA_END=280 /DNA_ORIENTATION=+